MNTENLSSRQKSLYRLLSNGGRYSVADIIRRLPIGDPRSVIRNLRNIGVNILDEWVDNKGGDGRHKVYFIKH